MPLFVLKVYLERWYITRMDYERTCKLFTPGPVNIPNDIALASIKASYHHRIKIFSDILSETLDMLKPLFGTDRPVYPVHTTGRGAIEGVINNILTPQDKVVAICNGNFGHMIAKILDRVGIPYIRYLSEWTDQVDIDALEAIILEQKATSITVVHNDTSNGLVNPIGDIGKLARKYNLTLIVDTVSGLACMPFLLDEWGVDAAITASQKGLMSPAGISFCTFSEKAESAFMQGNKNDYYIDFKSIKKTLSEKRQTPGSTPVSLVLAVHQAVNMIHDEGIVNVYGRHKELALRTRAALTAMGFELFPEECQTRSNSLSVARAPMNVDVTVLSKHLQNKYHVQIGKGLGKYDKELVRIAHMGYYYTEDMIQCISLLEASMYDLGYVKGFDLGKGLSAYLSAND